MMQRMVVRCHLDLGECATTQPSRIHVSVDACRSSVVEATESQTIMCPSCGSSHTSDHMCCGRSCHVPKWNYVQSRVQCCGGYFSKSRKNGWKIALKLIDCIPIHTRASHQTHENQPAEHRSFTGKIMQNMQKTCARQWKNFLHKRRKQKMHFFIVGQNALGVQ